MEDRSWMINRTLKLYGKQDIIKCSMTLLLGGESGVLSETV